MAHSSQAQGQGLPEVSQCPLNTWSICRALRRDRTAACDYCAEDRIWYSRIYREFWICRTSCFSCKSPFQFYPIGGPSAPRFRRGTGSRLCVKKNVIDRLTYSITRTQTSPLVFGSSFLILTMSISFCIRIWTCWQHLTGFFTKFIAALMLSALPGLICSRSSRVNSLSCCSSSCSRVFTLEIIDMKEMVFRSISCADMWNQFIPTCSDIYCCRNRCLKGHWCSRFWPFGQESELVHLPARGGLWQTRLRSSEPCLRHWHKFSSHGERWNEVWASPGLERPRIPLYNKILVIDYWWKLIQVSVSN